MNIHAKFLEEYNQWGYKSERIGLVVLGFFFFGDFLIIYVMVRHGLGWI